MEPKSRPCVIIFTIIAALAVATLLSVTMCVPAAAQNEKAIMDVTLLYGNFNGTVTPDHDNIVYIVIRNSGNTPLTHITFSYLAPPNWQVVFSPDSLESLSPGNSTTTEVNIRPSASTRTSNNNINLIVRSQEVQQVLTVYTQFESRPGYWLWIGAGIAAAVIAAFIYVYFRLNRKQ